MSETAPLLIIVGGTIVICALLAAAINSWYDH